MRRPQNIRRPYGINKLPRPRYPGSPPASRNKRVFVSADPAAGLANPHPCANGKTADADSGRGFSGRGGGGAA
ncbi:hypothetical protein SKAU_G00241200 [Synaphobranchus kaupii]|uniref:Uncharacterized protein n=1 Tax=Synaphobranchus kaupii TaxID=118154 RepID=A0A9Q1IU92_SYNKA|nr:hypothetical protein SKAU_G00241200 [Synaphobranchus kaupii]